MAEAYFVGITLICFALPLFALWLGKEFLIALLPILLITGNVFALAFVVIGGITQSLAVPVYATTFLVTDLLSEHYGRREALRAVWIGFLGQIIFLAVMLAVLSAPILPDNKDAYSATLSVVPRLVFGSFIAYLLSQNLDVRIYDVIRRLTRGKWLWLRNNLSTAISQAMDTVIFLTIAFWGVPPFEDRWVWGMFVLTTWLFKIAVALADTVAIYASYWIVQRKWVP